MRGDLRHSERVEEERKREGLNGQRSCWKLRDSRGAILNDQRLERIFRRVRWGEEAYQSIPRGIKACIYAFFAPERNSQQRCGRTMPSKIISAFLLGSGRLTAGGSCLLRILSPLFLSSQLGPPRLAGVAEYVLA